jgi:thiamine monophosphate synthase
VQRGEDQMSALDIELRSGKEGISPISSKDAYAESENVQNHYLFNGHRFPTSSKKDDSFEECSCAKTIEESI